MDFETRDLIFFTGAGFTANFGGFLAKDVAAQLYSHPLVRQSKKLRILLQDDPDFEAIYSEVLNNPTYSNDEKIAIKSAIEDTYRKLDDTTNAWIFNKDNISGFNIYKWGELIQAFSGNNSQKGIFFTLNQDIVMERRNGFQSPGVPKLNLNFSSQFNQESFITLPTDTSKVLSDIQSSGMSYIKLHGSYGWKSSDGSNQMVIGKNKTEIIDREPILKLYSEIFKEVIKQGNKKLLIIGYSFRDEHINLILLEGVKNYGLQLYIISPTPLADFKAKLPYYAKEILEEGLIGYYPYTLQKIFPPDQSQTTYYTDIQRDMGLV